MQESVKIGADYFSISAQCRMQCRAGERRRHIRHNHLQSIVNFLAKPLMAVHRATLPASPIGVKCTQASLLLEIVSPIVCNIMKNTTFRLKKLRE